MPPSKTSPETWWGARAVASSREGGREVQAGAERPGQRRLAASRGALRCAGVDRGSRARPPTLPASLRCPRPQYWCCSAQGNGEWASWAYQLPAPLAGAQGACSLSHGRSGIVHRSLAQLAGVHGWLAAGRCTARLHPRAAPLWASLHAARPAARPPSAPRRRLHAVAGAHSGDAALVRRGGGGSQKRRVCFVRQPPLPVPAQRDGGGARGRDRAEAQPMTRRAAPRPATAAAAAAAAAARRLPWPDVACNSCHVGTLSRGPGVAAARAGSGNGAHHDASVAVLAGSRRAS